ncbi:hypothetical protein SAMN04487866_105118 [Thermoactinomyces sp. DSM 45891]|nr:hypothetical protein [Thermoactinomyces sp. DSM 45891]SFX35688.1 hypothetical protein SAMN04487866_105118 [Thermoactinomyces sp. DSM 45891]
MKKCGVSLMFVLFLTSVLPVNPVVKNDIPNLVKHSAEPVGG